MSFLVDTNIYSVYLKRPGGLTHRFMQHMGRLSISTVSLAELYAWAYRRPDPRILLNSIEELLKDVITLDFTPGSARKFGQLSNELKIRGITVSSADLMIASIALEHDYTLVTHNVKDFKNIPDLRIVDWLVE